MIRRIQALGRRCRERFAGAEDGSTLPELLIVVVIASVVVGTIGSAFVVTGKTATASKTRLNESHDTQMVSAYFVADASSATYFSTTTGQATLCSAAGTGESNVALFEWTDDSVTKSAYYITRNADTSAGEVYPRLIRRYCEDSTTKSELPLVKNLSTTNPVVTCPLDASCTTMPSAVELQVTENSGYDYTLRASPRRTGTAGGGMGGIAAYVGGGGLLLGGNSTLEAFSGSGIVQVTGGDTACNGSKSLVVADGFTASDSTNTNCETPLTTNPLPDPLRNLPTPTKPGAPSTTPSAKKCTDTSLTPLNAGEYPATNDKGKKKAPEITNACLTGGLYYFEDGASLKNVQAADGVVLYVATGGLTLESVDLRTTSSGDQAGVTVFMARDNTNSVTISLSNVVDGVIYAPKGTISLQGDKDALTTGGVNASRIEVQGGGSIDID